MQKTKCKAENGILKMCRKYAWKRHIALFLSMVMLLMMAWQPNEIDVLAEEARAGSHQFEDCGGNHAKVQYTLSETDKALIESVPEESHIGMYLDISCLKKIGHDEAVQIHQLNKEVSITINVPQEMINSDPNMVRTYFVIRIHGGVVQRLDAVFNEGKITFSTDRFSTYALAYSDAPKEGVTSPNTGVADAYVWLLVLVVFAAIGAAAAFVGVKRRIKE